MIFIFILNILFGQILAQEVETRICSELVDDRIESFATRMSSIALSSHCESGTFEADNCIIGEFEIDRNCSGQSAERILAMATAIRRVKGQEGLGCLNQMNATYAEALSNAFANQNIRLCCNGCAGDPSTSLTGGAACAQTFAPPHGVGITRISLNMDSIMSEGDCGGAHMAEPLEGTIFHELLHAAGVCGVNNHSAGRLPDPDTGPEGSRRELDERNVLQDPIYGCQYSCFGRGHRVNSAACLSCAAGELPRTTREDDVTTGFTYLRNRLFQLYDRVESDPASIPPRCQQLRNQGPNEVGRRLQQAQLAQHRAMAQNATVLGCLSGFRMSTVADSTWQNCLNAYNAFRTACQDYERAVTFDIRGERRCITTSEFALFSSDAVAGNCASTLSQFQNTMIGRVRGRLPMNPAATCAAIFTGNRICTNIRTTSSSAITAEQCNSAAAP